MEPAAEAYEPLTSRSRWAERGLIAAVVVYAVSAISAYVSYRVY